MRSPGIEPGSTAWKATMLTITPATHLYAVRGRFGAGARILGRVVKALDLSPSGHSPRGFEPRSMHS
jgi:hypothetical protein